MKGYTRVWRRLWDDEKFRSLPSHPGQFVVLYILSAAANRIGIFTVSLGDLAERLDLRPSDCAKVVGEVAEAMSWGWDESSRTIWIESWWRWNRPESPKAILGYMRDLDDVPESALRKSYLRTRPELPDSLLEAYRKAIDSLRVRARARLGTEPEKLPEPEPIHTPLPPEPDSGARPAEAGITTTPPTVSRAQVVAFAQAYPRQDGHRAIEREMLSALTRVPTLTADDLVWSAGRYARQCQRDHLEPRFIPRPPNWLADDRFLEHFHDDPPGDPSAAQR